MPQIYLLCMLQYELGVAAMPWDWAVGSNSGHFLGSFCPATGTFCNEFRYTAYKYATAATFWPNVVAFTVCPYVECAFILVIMTFPVLTIEENKISCCLGKLLGC